MYQTQLPFWKLGQRSRLWYQYKRYAPDTIVLKTLSEIKVKQDISRLRNFYIQKRKIRYLYPIVFRKTSILNSHQIWSVVCPSVYLFVRQFVTFLVNTSSFKPLDVNLSNITVNKTEYRSKEIQQVNPGAPDKQPKHQELREIDISVSSLNMSFNNCFVLVSVEWTNKQ